MKGITMDPNATLTALRNALADGDAESAAEYFEALDEWLEKGGFLPTVWEGTSRWNEPNRSTNHLNGA
jgi:hypothetical protein